MIDHHQVVELDPLSPWGYERRHAALHKAGEYQNAVNAFEEMLSRHILQSPTIVQPVPSGFTKPHECGAGRGIGRFT